MKYSQRFIIFMTCQFHCIWNLYERINILATTVDFRVRNNHVMNKHLFGIHRQGFIQVFFSVFFFGWAA